MFRTLGRLLPGSPHGSGVAGPLPLLWWVSVLCREGLCFFRTCYMTVFKNYLRNLCTGPAVNTHVCACLQCPHPLFHIWYNKPHTSSPTRSCDHSTIKVDSGKDHTQKTDAHQK